MNTIIYLWIFILGAIMGSFLGCMGYRIPNKIKTTFPSSFCANCKKSLKWYMNIPIISYIFLKGKCYYCKDKIGIIYFLCEIICSFLFVFSYYLFGFSYEFFLSIVIICMLVVTIVSDFLFYYISDRVLIIGGIASLILTYIFKSPTDVLTNIVSGLIIFLLMIGLKILGNSLFRRESLGDGDIKLMGVIGIMLGLLNSFISLFFAAVIALIYGIIQLFKDKECVIPFGPFILLGSLLVIYLSNEITLFIDKFFTI